MDVRMAFVLTAVLLTAGVRATGADEIEPRSGKECQITANFTADPPQIDGHLGEKCWEDAEVATGFSCVPGTQMPKAQTEVRVLYDMERLYVAWTAHDDNVAEASFVRGTPHKHDAEGIFDFNSDEVELFLDTPAPGYFQFCATPAGAIFDRAAGGTDAPGERWNAEWEMAGSVGEDRYFVEMAIPFASLRTGDRLSGTPTPGEQWRVNFCRSKSQRSQAHGEWTHWSATGGEFHRPDKFGYMTFGPRPEGWNAFQVLPPEQWVIGTNVLRVSPVGELSETVQATVKRRRPEGEEDVKIDIPKGTTAPVEIPLEFHKTGRVGLEILVRRAAPSGPRSIYVGAAVVDLTDVGGMLEELLRRARTVQERAASMVEAMGDEAVGLQKQAGGLAAELEGLLERMRLGGEFDAAAHRAGPWGLLQTTWATGGEQEEAWRDGKKRLPELKRSTTELQLRLLTLSSRVAASGKDSAPTRLDAEGFADTRGGRGGKILRVTNLDAEGPGSLRAALEVKGPRIIVFEVGGVLDLKKKSLVIREPFVTIAGQTAPYPGITIIRGGVYVDTHDVVIRHIRVRPGDAGERKVSGWQPYGMRITASNVLIDHCSISWGVDDNTCVSGPRPPQSPTCKVTFSNCIIAECLDYASHPVGREAFGTLIHDGCQEIAIIGNLYAHQERRNPLFQANTSGAIVNNVIYNPAQTAIELISYEWQTWMGSEFKPKNPRVSIVGNALVYGPETPSNLALVAPRGDAYLEDNLIFDPDDKPGPVVWGNIVRLKEKPVWPEGLQALPAKHVIGYVMQHAGARPRDRDEVDKRIIRDFYQYKGGLIDSQDEVGGYPSVEMTRRELDIPAENVESWLDSLAEELE